MTAKLTSFGGCSCVTGSMHLLDLSEEVGYPMKILLDAGSFQGKDVREKNSCLPDGLNPMDINYILLSHAHLDHVGRLPMLVRRGFHGKIICTTATRDITFIVLDNMIKVQNSDTDFEKDKDIGLLTEKNIELTKRLFVPIRKEYGKLGSSDGKFVVTFINAEHIAGSACIYIEKPIKLLYTGDLGGSRSSLHKIPIPPAGGIDYLIIESTYGNRVIEKRDAMVLINAIKDIKENRGRLLIPILAIDRAEEILALMKSLNVEETVYLDSPMALDVLSIYTSNSFVKVSDKFNRVQIKDRNLNADQVYYSFKPKNFIEVSKNTKLVSNCIILSSSGMLEGGRILKYLPDILDYPNNIILFTSYLGKGTLGRRILDGEVKVKASVRKMDGISSHADKNDIMEYISKFSYLPKTAFVVHGESNASENLKKEIENTFGITTIIPNYNEEYELPKIDENEIRRVVVTKNKEPIDDFDDGMAVVEHKDFSPRRR